MRPLNKLLFFCLVFPSLLILKCKSPSKEEIKFEQYYNEGKRLYTLHCSNCHMKSGTGLARLYPPLKDSDYLKENIKNVVCSIKYGQEGEIVVNGVTYNQPMPENPRLTNLEIAEISTYIYARWADRKEIFHHQEIDSILTNCIREKQLSHTFQQ